MGPMTGRGIGPCGRSLGFGRRQGCHRNPGRYFGWNAPQTKDDRIKDTQDYLEALKEEVDAVQKHLTELQS